jgi:hypothetical protein
MAMHGHTQLTPLRLWEMTFSPFFLMEKHNDTAVTVCRSVVDVSWGWICVGRQRDVRLEAEKGHRLSCMCICPVVVGKKPISKSYLLWLLWLCCVGRLL